MRYLEIYPKGLLIQNFTELKGHLGVPDTVSEPLIVPLNYLVILHWSWTIFQKSEGNMQGGSDFCMILQHKCLLTLIAD